MVKLLFLVGLSLLALAGQANATVTVINIPSNPIWTDTGINLSSSTFSISASGTWNWGGGSSGPAGDPNGCCLWDDWVPSANKGSLIGYVGANPYSAGSGWFYVGPSLTVSTPTTGKLWLGFNDDQSSGGIGDNSGYVNASITTPVPEPEEWVMMLLGAAMLSFQVKRKKASL